MSNIPTNKVAVAACPFCGGTDTACGIADEEFGRFWVECICGARGPTVETLKDARPAWNKRLAPEPVDDEQWQRSMEDSVRFRFFFDPHRGETSKAILGLTMKALTPPYPSVDAWRAAIDADRLGLTKAAPAVEPAGTASFNVTRYKVVQDKGEYCLKGCPDGDLVDFSAYAALLNGCTTPTKAGSET